MTTALDQFTTACFEAMEFTDASCDYPESGMFPESAELAEETRLDLEADCRSFWRRYGCYIMATGGATPTQAGHDFWLTRNGHGSGFRDRDISVYGPYVEMLVKGANAYGPFEMHVGDDGLVYA